MKLILLLTLWPILVNVPCAYDNNVYTAACGCAIKCQFSQLLIILSLVYWS